MITSTYAKAYTEVLEILSYLPEDEYSKIPKDKIEFYEKNKDKDYKYEINPELSISEQKISKEANAIFVGLYKKYFATEEQNEKIDEILEKNKEKIELEKSMKYNPNKIFAKEETIKKEIVSETVTEDMQIVESKKTIFSKIKMFILKIFGIEN